MDTKDNLKILIVEDDPIIAKDISSLLKSEDFSIAGVAHDGLTAIDMLENRKPDLVMLDIYLGTGISGIDVAEVIQQNYQIPFIFLTSFSDKETLEAAKQHAPYGYLVKPFQDRTLLTTIAMALSNFERQQNAATNNVSKYISHLTTQEKKYIQILLTGKSNKEIAAMLSISVNTVKFHLKNIFIKMDVSSRAELMSKLMST